MQTVPSTDGEGRPWSLSCLDTAIAVHVGVDGSLELRVFSRCLEQSVAEVHARACYLLRAPALETLRCRNGPSCMSKYSMPGADVDSCTLHLDAHVDHMYKYAHSQQPCGARSNPQHGWPSVLRTTPRHHDKLLPPPPPISIQTLKLASTTLVLVQSSGSQRATGED